MILRPPLERPPLERSPRRKQRHRDDHKSNRDQSGNEKVLHGVADAELKGQLTPFMAANCSRRPQELGSILKTAVHPIDNTAPAPLPRHSLPSVHIPSSQAHKVYSAHTTLPVVIPRVPHIRFANHPFFHLPLALSNLPL